MMSLDQEQTDEELKSVFEMVDEDGSGMLDKEEVALVIEYFSGTCALARPPPCSRWICVAITHLAPIFTHFCVHE